MSNNITKANCDMYVNVQKILFYNVYVCVVIQINYEVQLGHSRTCTELLIQSPKFFLGIFIYKRR